VYWIPVYEILEARGLEVVLVNARHLRNVRGRKSDVSDCEWLRDLHSVGLLSPSFRPADEIVALRSYTRQRESLAGGRYSYPAHAQGANRDESSAARRAQ
jgi:transposase